MHHRQHCFKALVGSYNYNLYTSESDKDYKTFFFPTFDDLYRGGQYSKSIVSDTEDVEYHDIRKLPSLLYKSNVNFMEVLFSEEYEIYDEELFLEIFTLRDSIATMNLPYLYDACYGMYLQKMKEYKRDKENGFVSKTCKHAMSSYRILDFLERFDKQSFSSFKASIQYGDDEPTRTVLLDIRNRKYSFEQLEELLEDKEIQIKKLENQYKSFEVNEHLNEKLDNIIKAFVKKAICN